MHNETTIVGIIRDRQKAMRREIDRRGIALKVIAYDSGIKYDTLLTYLPADPLAQPAQMPASVVYALTGVLPGDILSLLLPTGHLIVKAPEQIDHDAVVQAVEDYISEKLRSHHPESPAGREIADCEDVRLCTKLAVITGGRAAA